MSDLTLSHWGVNAIERDADGVPRLAPWGGDPDPSPIGGHDLADVDRLRVRRPAVRRSYLAQGHRAGGEGRGREPFVEVPWDEALDIVAGEIARVKRENGNAAIFGGSYGWASAGRFHHSVGQLHRFLNAVGGYVRHTDTYSLGAGRVLMPYVLASMDEIAQGMTSWEVMAAHTRLFVTFGGVPLKNAQISSGGAGRHRVRDGLRRMREAGTRFVNVSPVRDDLDVGGSFEWIPIRPGTDAALMLALAYVLEREGLADRVALDRLTVGYDRFRPYLLGAEDGVPKTPAWAEAITGVPAERIARLARELHAERSMLNCAWALQRADHGEQPFWALTALAAMVGQIGLAGGGFGLGYGAMNAIGGDHLRISGPTLPQGAKPGGREPVLMNAEDARERGIAEGDAVRLSNARGACLAAAVLSDGIMRGVAKLSTGAWFDPAEGGAQLDRHGNPNALTRDAGASALSQGCAAQTCLVAAERVTSPPATQAFDLPRFAARRGEAALPTIAGPDGAGSIREHAFEEALP